MNDSKNSDIKLQLKLEKKIKINNLILLLMEDYVPLQMKILQ